MSESSLSREILRDLASSTSLRLFRNNTALSWVGEPVRRWNTIEGSYLTIKNPRPLRAGLVVGGSDYIGWNSITITPDMIGQQIAVFTALEFKAEKRSRRTEAQRNFVGQVNKAGGRAGFATSIEEARRITGV